MSGRDDPARVLEAARIIRRYLPDLVEQVEAGTIDKVISYLLAFPAEKESQASTRLLGLLAIRPGIKAWLDRVLDDEDLRPPEFQDVEHRGTDAIGGARAVPARQFACVDGDFVWFQRTAADVPPICPTHGGELVVR